MPDLNSCNFFLGKHICYLYLNQSELEFAIEDVEGTDIGPLETLL